MALINISESEREREKEREREREREREAGSSVPGDHLLRRSSLKVKERKKRNGRGSGDNEPVVRRKPIFPSSRRQRPYAPRRPIRKRKFHLPAACGTTFFPPLAVFRFLVAISLPLLPLSLVLSWSLSVSFSGLPSLPSFSFLPRANYDVPIAVRVCYHRSFRLP
jgi:hypothetical protein